MSQLETTVEEVLAAAEKLQAARAAGSEANTKALLIEPALSALGWNLTDIGEFQREFRVFDGTLIDYVLRIDAKPKLFVEAKALNKSLDEKTFVAQTVNYANNEGVPWCVLTNGVEYKVYKSNAPGGMAEKLLFEVDLRDAQEERVREEVVRSLRMLDREALQSGRLDQWGEEVFTDVRVRASLAKLGQDPPEGLLRAVAGAMDDSTVKRPELRKSLGRILGRLSASALPPLQPPAKKPSMTKNGKKTSWDVARHVKDMPSAIVDLFERVDALARSMGSDVTQRPTKWYIGYHAGKRSFVTADLRKSKINVYLSLPPGETKPWDDSSMRDVSAIGHQGLGNTEFVLRSPEQLPALEQLMKASYLRNRR